MSYNARFGSDTNEHETELRLAKELEQVCNPATDTGIERLKLIKERLLALFVRLQRGEVSTTDAKTQSLQLQESLSQLIWTLDDWELQSNNRN
jgi:hypothetical protein